MDNLIFINVVPLDHYMHWQEEVMITNFLSKGIKNIEILVWYPKHRELELKNWKTLETKYPTVKFFYYEDSGVNLNLYIPQLRPHTLKKHFKKHKFRLKDKVFFYHDADIIFRELPDFELLMKDNIVWQSDCSGYLDYSYLKRKEIEGNIPENELVNLLEKIGNLSPNTIKNYNNKTGGAQTLLKNIDYKFWEDVERLSMDIRVKLFHGIPNSINTKYFKDENSGVQSWCCDMWALNFALWKRNIKTDVHKELDFSWASDTNETYLKKNIYHNTGASSSKDGTFLKTEWINKSPIGINLPINENSASKYYVEAINNVIR